MVVVALCLLVVLLGGIAALRWGHLDVRPPWEPGLPPLGEHVRRVLWWLDLAMISGIVAGIAGAGAGGRLVMRLLAVTAGESAQGRITEADEVVGEVTVGGTIGFLVFIGIGTGLFTAALYVLLRRWLPPGRAGAFVFAALLLVVAATRVDPLRADNEDFALLGPDWLAVVAFVAVAVYHALVLAAVAGRLSRSLPMLEKRPAALLAYLPLLLLPLTTVAFVVLVVVLAAGVALQRAAWFRSWWASPAVRTGGWVVLALVVLVAAPGFVSSVADIL